MMARKGKLDLSLAIAVVTMYRYICIGFGRNHIDIPQSWIKYRVLNSKWILIFSLSFQIGRGR